MKKIIAFLLTFAMALSLCSITAMADQDTPTYVNFGDSISLGNIENDNNYPDYNREKDGWSPQLAKKLNAEWINYARRGMQTTDILYMIDPVFQEQVDSGVLKPDSWHTNEYPPYDETSLETVRSDLKDADYVSLCIGSCDIISYPGELRTQAMERIPDKEALKAELIGYLDAKKLDQETYYTLAKLITAYSAEAYITVKYILDMVDGLADYVKYYPQIVKCMRDAAPEATIILIGNYIPLGTIPFLEETDTSGELIFCLNRLLDNINIVVKKAAAKYDCYYVDTMGIQSDWHPTVLGQTQLCERVMSVLNGDPVYAGNVQAIDAIMDGKLFKKQ